MSAKIRLLMLSAYVLVGSLLSTNGFTQEWHSFAVELKTDYYPVEDPETGARCNSYQFTIESDGSYSVRPCGYSNSSERRGNITRSELNQLDQIADSIVSDNLPELLSCEDSEAISAGSYTVTLSVGPNPAGRKFLEYIPSGVNFRCSRGPEDNLDELSQFFSQFLDRYLPEWGNLVP